MPTPPTATSRLLRLGIAFAGLAFAAFFGALGVAIVFDPMTGEPAWAAWLLRGFITFIFGALTAGGLSFAAQALRTERAPLVPPAVTERCPACGEPWSQADTCDACDLPRALAAGWHATPREGVGALLFGGAFGGGIACLGLFLAAHAFFGDEKRVLLLIAHLGLAGLITAGGAGLSYGLVIALRDAWRARGERAFSFQHNHGGREILATAHVSRHGIEMNGSAEIWFPIEQGPSGESASAEIPPVPRALAQVVAALHARGQAGLSYVERRAWSWSGERLARSAERDVHVDAPLPRDQAHTVDARDVVLMALGDGSLREVSDRAAESPDLAAALETFAARLATVEVDGRVLSVLTQVACRAEAGPYRAPG